MTAVRYPWDKWLKGRKLFELTRWKDYSGMPHAMAVQVRAAAHNRGLKISVRIGDDGVLRCQVTGRIQRGKH